MKANTQPKAAATPAALPSFQQMMALALEKTESDLRGLIRIRCNDEHWDEDADVHVDFAVELALSHVERMKTMGFEESLGFCAEWFKVVGAVNLAHKSFSRNDCLYSRSLKSACCMLDQVMELVDYCGAPA